MLDPGFFVAGEIVIKVRKGKVEIFGAPYSKGDEILIPKHRSAPVYIIEDSEFDMDFGEGSFIAESKEPLISQDWIQLADRLVKEENGYTVMAIGNVDTGKTGLITYLANRVLLAGKKVGIVDADTGQSDIGPPSTIGLGTIKKPIIHLSQAELVDAFFVGNVTPAEVLDRSITGTHMMVKRAKELGFDIILMDTTGWVGDRWGRELKIMKFLTIDPDLVVFIEKERGELWHLEKSLIGYTSEICHVSAPPRIRARSREERWNIRAELFREEFEDAREVVISLDSVGIMYGFIGTGNPPKEGTLEVLEKIFGEDIPYTEESDDAIVFVTETRLPRSTLDSIKMLLRKREVVNVTKEDLYHLLIGLTDANGHYLGLGIILDFDPREKKLLVLTRARLDILSSIQFGHMKVNPNGEEEGKFSPWIV